MLADFAEKLLEAERARAFQILDPSSGYEGGRVVSRAGLTKVAVCINAAKSQKLSNKRCTSRGVQGHGALTVQLPKYYEVRYYYSIGS